MTTNKQDELIIRLVNIAIDTQTGKLATNHAVEMMLINIKSEVAQALKELKEEAVANPTTPAGDVEFVTIEAIDNKIKELEKL